MRTKDEPILPFTEKMDNVYPNSIYLSWFHNPFIPLAVKLFNIVTVPILLTVLCGWGYHIFSRHFVCESIPRLPEWPASDFVASPNRRLSFSRSCFFPPAFQNPKNFTQSLLKKHLYRFWSVTLQLICSVVIYLLCNPGHGTPHSVPDVVYPRTLFSCSKISSSLHPLCLNP